MVRDDSQTKLARLLERYGALLRERERAVPGSPGYHGLIFELGTVSWRIKQLEKAMVSPGERDIERPPDDPPP